MGRLQNSTVAYDVLKSALMVRIAGPEFSVRSDITPHKGPPIRGKILPPLRFLATICESPLLSSRDDLSWLLTLSTSFGVTENCSSATPRSVLGSSFRFPAHAGDRRMMGLIVSPFSLSCAA